MLNTIFATKVGMSQAWSKSGKRLPVTRLVVDDNCVISVKATQDQKFTAEIAYGHKKIKNVSKPLTAQLAKSGFSSGFRQIKGIKIDEAELKAGDKLDLSQVLAVGDVVAVQGTSKGRGFAGGVKRYHFHGGPRTHGQSDRQRAIGSIGSGTDPGRVWKGKRMAGHYGVESKTVKGLTVVYIDPDKRELWLSGPVPGAINSILRIEKSGSKRDLSLDLAASGLKVETKTASVVEADEAVVTEPVVEVSNNEDKPSEPAKQEAAATEKPAVVKEQVSKDQS